MHVQIPHRDRVRWIDLLEQIVNIDSGPDAPEGAHAVMDLLAHHLRALDFDTHRHPTGLGPDILTAHRNGPQAGPRLLLLGHADTVFFQGTAHQRPFTIHPNRHATGPGIADMKAGLIVALAALHATPPRTLDQLSITLLVNGDEEQGSVYSRPHIEHHADHADIALVFEPGRAPNAVVTARRGAQRYRLHVTGKAAHTGSNPQDGANAIETIAHHTLTIQTLGRSLPQAEVTAVLIGGGTRPNIVPDAAYLHIDTRFDNPTDGDHIHQTIMQLAGPGPTPGTDTEVEVLDGRPPYNQDQNAHGLTTLFATAATDLNLPFDTTTTGGSSDGNFTSARGIPTLDGLGAIGTGYHTAHEHIQLDTLIPRAQLCATALHHLTQTPPAPPPTPDT